MKKLLMASAKGDGTARSERQSLFALGLSLSHGARWLCPAIGRGIMVGADIEALPDPDEIDGVVELMFSKRERCRLRRLQRPSWLPSLDRREEALKREGQGLQGNVCRIFLPWP